MYKIYIKDLPLIITDAPDKAQFQDYLILPDDRKHVVWEDVVSGKMHSERGFVVHCRDKEKFFRHLFKEFKKVDAAGGLVQNTDEDYLFIFRKGKWDLPKGKIDEGETAPEAAIREVEEECGVKKLKLGEHLLNTYHVYDEDHKQVLKKTWWYQMSCPVQKLKPQEEEGITEARWFCRKDFTQVFANTWPSIKDVLEFAD